MSSPRRTFQTVVARLRMSLLGVRLGSVSIISAIAITMVAAIVRRSSR